jgi:hypothetical protein
VIAVPLSAGVNFITKKAKKFACKDFHSAPK